MSLVMKQRRFLLYFLCRAIKGRGMGGGTCVLDGSSSGADFRWLLSFPVQNLFPPPPGGSESSATLGSNSGLGMGQNELQEEGNFPKEVFCLDDVANYECVTSSEATPAAPNQVDPETGDPGQRRKSSALGSKPNNTYTEIIAKALEEYPNGLTVSEIYEYISYDILK